MGQFLDAQLCTLQSRSSMHIEVLKGIPLETLPFNINANILPLE